MTVSEHKLWNIEVMEKGLKIELEGRTWEIKSEQELGRIIKEVKGLALENEELGKKLDGLLQEIKEKWKETQEPRPIVLDHLNLIENPQFAGQLVIVDGIIASTSVAYQSPKVVIATILQENEDDEVIPQEIEPDDPVNLKLILVPEETKIGRLRRLVGVPRGRVRIEEKAWRTVYFLRIRPVVATLEKKGGIVVDERGFEYKSFDVFVVTDQAIPFEPGKKVRLTARPLASPKNQKKVLLAWKVAFPEETTVFDVEKLRKLKKKLDIFHSIEEKVEWILDNFEKYSKIRKRKNLALAGFLGYFSPIYITFDGKTERGWLIILIIGDTTTGKSETSRLLRELLKAGIFISAEVASQAGLAGSAVQIEKQGWFVDWGYLVLSDRKLLAIDGVHKLPKSAWASLAESMREGVVDMAKAAKGRANARTRLLLIANPLDREAGRFSTKELGSFLFPAQALTTVFDNINIARLDLAVFSNAEDVKAEDVNKEDDGEYDLDLELLAESLRWCWSGKTELIFTKEAKREILRIATELYNEFNCKAIPLVTIDMKYKLARLSAALAYLTLSTDENFEKVFVTPEHVHYIANFLREEYRKAGLHIIAKEEKFEIPSKEEAEKIIEEIAGKSNIEEDKVKKIIKFITLQGRVKRDQLKTEFDLARDSQLRPLLASLETYDLIKRGNGFYPTKKLIAMYKALFSLIQEAPSKLHRQPSTQGTNDMSKGYPFSPNMSEITEVTGDVGSRQTRQIRHPDKELPPPYPSINTQGINTSPKPINELLSNGATQSQVDETYRDSILRCPYCDSEFVTLTDLKNHIETNHGRFDPVLAAAIAWERDSERMLEITLRRMGRSPKIGEATYFFEKMREFKEKNDLQGWLNFVYALEPEHVDGIGEAEGDE